VSVHSAEVLAVSEQLVGEVAPPEGYAYKVATEVPAETASREPTLAKRNPPMRSVVAKERRTRPDDREPLREKR
jgi:hypothetical protein